MSSPTDRREESLPLLSPSPSPSPSSSSAMHPPSGAAAPATRSKLGARRQLTDKAKGKQRADPALAAEYDLEAQHGDQGMHPAEEREKPKPKPKPQMQGRRVAIIFSNEGKEGNLELWVDPDETVGSVKDQIRHLRPSLSPLSLRLIHSGRLLTDGILLIPWLRSLEDRLRRQASTMGGDVESVLKEVGLADDEGAGPGRGKGKQVEEDRAWLHCIVGGRLDEKQKQDGVAGADEEETTAPRRRGFDSLLDAGLSPADVANMRRQFYESRGEEVPEGLDAGDVNDEHARALEEQWIEGDLTAETATTSSDGMYSGIMHGLLTGFFWPVLPIFLFRDPPLPNFFDADAEAQSAGSDEVSTRVAGSAGVGGETLPSGVFGQRMQMGVVLGFALNLGFGALRMLN